MNDQWFYIKKKVLVTNEGKGSRILQYTDNIGEVLTCENIVEGIENDINELDKNNKKKSTILQIIKYISKGIASFSLLVGAMLGILSLLSIIYVPNIIDFLTVEAIIEIIMMPTYIISNYKLEKTQSLYKKKHDYLEQEFAKTKYKLNELRKNRTNKNEKHLVESLIPNKITADKEYLQYLKYRLLFLTNERKYHRYYKQGKLQSKLGISEFMEAKIERYFEERENNYQKEGNKVVKVKNKYL